MWASTTMERVLTADARGQFVGGSSPGKPPLAIVPPTTSTTATRRKAQPTCRSRAELTPPHPCSHQQTPEKRLVTTLKTEPATARTMSVKFATAHPWSPRSRGQSLAGQGGHQLRTRGRRRQPPTGWPDEGPAPRTLTSGGVVAARVPPVPRGTIVPPSSRLTVFTWGTPLR
jgi:hypothetical protein